VLTAGLTGAAVAAGGLGAFAAVATPSSKAARIIAWSAIASMVGATGVLLLVAAGVERGHLDRFGVMHAVYLLLAIGIPVVGLGLLARSVRVERPAGLRVLGALLLVPGAVGFWATHVEPFRLVVDEVPVAVDAARAGDDPVRIAVLADLQTGGVGDHERRAITEVLEADADLVLLPGDLFGGSDAEFDRALPALREQLQRLHARHGVFFVQGDAEHGDRAQRALEGTQVQTLEGDVVELSVGDRTVVLGGHAVDYGTLEAERTRDALVAASGGDAITILLAHRPDTVLGLEPSAGIDLTVAGHTHGGQVVVPGIGPLITMSEVPRAVAQGGLHEIDGNRIYVSPGVGMERRQAPQIRLFSRPTVAVLTLAG
jgi:predicted MPP superfamily phosphohydrolase